MDHVSTTPILDLHIRRKLRAALTAEHGAESDCVILDEMAAAQHSARADLAVINGSLSAFEIKSDRDSLQRLDGQLAIYLACFDFVTVVCTARHVAAVHRLAPRRVGILIFDPDHPEGFVRDRVAKPNRRLHAQSVVGFLWRDEAYAVLRRHGLSAGMSSARKHSLYSAIVKGLDTATIAAEVRWAIKQRGDWRAARQRTEGDGSSRMPANRSGSRARVTRSQPLRSMRRPS